MRPPKWAFFILALVAFELIADVLAKQFALSGKWVFAVTAILGVHLGECRLAREPAARHRTEQGRYPLLGAIGHWRGRHRPHHLPGKSQSVSVPRLATGRHRHCAAHCWVVAAVGQTFLSASHN